MIQYHQFPRKRLAYPMRWHRTLPTPGFYGRHTRTVMVLERTLPWTLSFKKKMYEQLLSVIKRQTRTWRVERVRYPLQRVLRGTL